MYATEVQDTTMTGGGAAGPAPSTDSAVRIEDLGKRYGDLWALRHLDLDVPKGTVLGLLGPVPSEGTPRRLGLAATIVSRPSVLFLAEPTTGLDPRGRNALWDTLRDIAREGTTIILTPQYLDEADRLADDIVVLDHGAT